MTLFKLFSFSAISLYYTSAKTFEKDNSEAWDKDKRRSGECDKGLSNSQTKVSHTQTWSLEDTFSLWGIESFCNTTMRCINPDKFKLNHHDLDRWVIPIICVSTSFVKTAKRENYWRKILLKSWPLNSLARILKGGKVAHCLSLCISSCKVDMHGAYFTIFIEKNIPYWQ